jgi:hypothetical protein
MTPNTPRESMVADAARVRFRRMGKGIRTLRVVKKRAAQPPAMPAGV